MRLGQYELLSRLGAGAMGDVWLARDATLGRQVAIKLLPDALAADPDRLARFEREARVLASLNHPNIAQVYGFEKATREGHATYFLVLELVPGNDIAERLEQGAIAMDDAVAIARQIAEALEAAHDAGIIHRDLKPANVRVRDDGTVKVLDFGLAKASQASVESQAGPGLDAATRTAPASLVTQHGVILGTAAYMAPEQAKGRPVDRRADIWAFGCLFYEMLTGRRAFAGDTLSETIANVLKEPPDWAALPAGTPGSVHRLLRRCLEKDPRRRLQSMGDARLELEDNPVGDAVTMAKASAGVAVSAGVRRTSRLNMLALAALAGAAVIGWGLFLRPSAGAPAEDGGVLRLSVTPPDQHRLVGADLGGDSEAHWAVSPEGRRLVFAATDSENRQQLWLRSFDSFALQALAGTEGADAPFWSPDGQFIAFVADARLKRVAVNGGNVRTLCAASNNTRGTWGLGTILFTDDTALWQVPEAGGEPQRVEAVGIPVWPSFLPDGRRFVYLDRQRLSADRRIILGSLDSPDRKELVRTPFMALPAAGSLLFLKDGLLVSQRLDASRGALTGPLSTVVEDLSLAEVPGQAKVASSAAGVIAYRPRAFVFESQLVWVSREGRVLDEVGDPAGYVAFDVAPDGHSVSMAIQDRSVENEEPPSLLWLFDMSRRVRTRFTIPEVRSAENPLWSPDGSRLVFASHPRAGALAEVRAQSANGTGTSELIASGPMNPHPIDWSRDGRHLLLHASGAGLGRLELWTIDLAGDRKPTLYVKNDASAAQGQFSPDGRYIAYASTVSGRAEVYLQRFPATSDRWQISAAGGSQPRWRGDGREVFYVAPGGTITGVPVTLGPATSVGAPTNLFRAPILETEFFFYGGALMYSVSADGQRFLINRSIRRSGSGTIDIVLNGLRQ